MKGDPEEADIQKIPFLIFLHSKEQWAYSAASEFLINPTKK